MGLSSQSRFHNHGPHGQGQEGEMRGAPQSYGPAKRSARRLRGGTSFQCGVENRCFKDAIDDHNGHADQNKGCSPAEDIRNSHEANSGKNQHDHRDTEEPRSEILLHRQNFCRPILSSLPGIGEGCIEAAADPGACGQDVNYQQQFAWAGTVARGPEDSLQGGRGVHPSRVHAGSVLPEA